MTEESKKPNHEHAWRGTWDRPMHMDENLMHPFTVARMTSHNVKGHDNKVAASKEKIETWENEGGALPAA